MALIQCILAIGVQLWWQISSVLDVLVTSEQCSMDKEPRLGQDEPRMQVASTFRSPFKEIILFFMCVGVLWGGLLVEQAPGWNALNVLDANSWKTSWQCQAIKIFSGYYQDEQSQKNFEEYKDMMVVYQGFFSSFLCKAKLCNLILTYCHFASVPGTKTGLKAGHRWSRATRRLVLERRKQGEVWEVCNLQFQE